MTALPAVVDAVSGDGEVYIDGGIRRGSDVVKCIALGAKACMIGRPYVYGLAAGGQAGVEKVIRLLMSEIDTTMGLLGRPTLKDLDATAVGHPA
jgi:L-lactate dehydrogenase (cytochrome)